MRIALIGAGTMGRIHAEALSRIANVDVVAFGAPTLPPEPAALMERLGAIHLPSAAAVLERPDVDAVVVAVPTDVHHEIVVAAARAGKQIICEKPLARTREQGEAMLAAVAQA